MKITKDLLSGLRRLRKSRQLTINEEEFKVVDVQVLPEMPFVLNKKKERKSEGLEFWLRKTKSKATYKLEYFDYDVLYTLVMAVPGVKDDWKQYGRDYTFAFDFIKGTTSIYKNTYKPKKPGNVRMLFRILDGKPLAIKSIRFALRKKKE